jgi:transcriptional regulator with XRE-family HTH domain
MSEGKLFALTQRESQDTILAKFELLASLRDAEYRQMFVGERVRSSMALQIRALREQREMSQKALGDAIGMAQTWVSKLENPDYGKMSVATLLRLATAFDTDLEIKFRPFSSAIDRLPKQTDEYFRVPSFKDEFEGHSLSEEEIDKAIERLNGEPVYHRSVTAKVGEAVEGCKQRLGKIGPTSERLDCLYASR